MNDTFTIPDEIADDVARAVEILRDGGCTALCVQHFPCKSYMTNRKFGFTSKSRLCRIPILKR